MAEEITDATLMKEPLAQPGKVIRKICGTLDEHMAALPANPKRKPTIKADAPPAVTKSRRSKPKPRPFRAKLDEAEQSITDAEQQYDAKRRDLAVREAALRRERAALEADREGERERLEEAH